PPSGLLLAPMPVEDVGEYPSRVLRLCAILGVDWHIPRQAFDDGCNPLLPLADFFRGFARLWRGAQDLGTAGDELSAQLFEPMAQFSSGKAVVAVVGLDNVLVLGEDAVDVTE